MNETHATDRDPGGFGQKVTDRRRALGLDGTEVARRAGMHPEYLDYVESHADAQPSAAARARLAAALDTSVSWLQGGGANQPPGAMHPPASTPTLESLEPDECRALLGRGGIGRAVFVGDRGAMALPVNFRVDHDTVVFCTGDGAIAAAVRGGGSVGIEVDHLDEARGEGWSVIVSGEATLVDDPGELRRIEGLGIEPWAGGDRNLAVRVTERELSGRRILRGNG